MNRNTSYHYKYMTGLERVTRFFAAFLVSMFGLSLVLRIAGVV